MRNRILPLLAVLLLPACAQDDDVSVLDVTASQLAPQASAVQYWEPDYPVNNRFYAPCLDDTLVMTGSSHYRVWLVGPPGGPVKIHQTVESRQINPLLQVLSGTYWEVLHASFEQWGHFDVWGMDTRLIQNIMLGNDAGEKVKVMRNIFVNINANGEVVTSRPAVYTCNKVR